MKLSEINNVDELRDAARRRLPRLIFDFADGGAEDELTLRRNAADFKEIRFNPRILQGVAERSTATSVLGSDLATPIGVAPVGGNRLVHPDGELALARAAAGRGALYVVPMFSSFTMEEIAAAAPGAPRWLQVYLWKDRDVVRQVIARAKASGYHALCVTADAPVLGNRERDLRNGLRMPPRITATNARDVARHPRWLAHFVRNRHGLMMGNLRDVEGARSLSPIQRMAYAHELFDPNESWADIEWLRGAWDGPLLVKGLTNPDDARRAVAAGCDGVIVSNHGGRQLDGALSAIEALPAVVDAVDGAGAVILDGGVRRGSDVAKAIALGASACLVGRPCWFGLAVAGEAGAGRALQLLDTELDRAMALLGRRTIDELDVSCVHAARPVGASA
jgi:isopentenyl diphosphate isomerase/L-lactate dehydrogenase-like FMN-dependent dehydrogenase